MMYYEIVPIESGKVLAYGVAASFGADNISHSTSLPMLAFQYQGSFAAEHGFLRKNPGKYIPFSKEMEAAIITVPGLKSEPEIYFARLS
jgi:hypothetical protein